MNAITLDEQSLFDIAVQECGHVEAAFDLALLNDLSLTEELAVGTQLELTQAINNNVVNYYQINAICPATGIPKHKKLFDIFFDEYFE